LKEKELEIQNMKSEQTKAKNLHELSKLKKTNISSETDSLEKYVEEMEKIKKENLEMNQKIKELTLKLNDQKEENIVIKTQMTKIIDEQSVVYETHINEFINQIYEVFFYFLKFQDSK
jgi:predicted Zn-dependent protease